MPKIEVNKQLFFNLLGKEYEWDVLEKKLVCAKAELDETPSGDFQTIKIELNDTNRPDLWSAAGVARCLREYDGEAHRDYSSFISRRGELKSTGDRVAIVDKELEYIRPFMVAFVASGKSIDDTLLVDIMQTQEKICWNFGRKRAGISMGVYRAANVKWPVHFRVAEPVDINFKPLQMDKVMNGRDIIKEHPKGKEYGWILRGVGHWPVLCDDSGEVMSLVPIINSATLGQIEIGDKDLLIEMTGTSMKDLMLASNIVACDLADEGFQILPVKVVHQYETGFGREVVTPYYFQTPTKARLSAINKKLGKELSSQETEDALRRMGSDVETTQSNDDTIFTVHPAPYRNDFLHEVDAVEDVMIGKGLDFFNPEKPRDFTIGRLHPDTVYSRKVKSLLAGLGYQEMVFNYLGSKTAFIDNMGIDGSSVIEIANPMSENYQFVRPSIIPSLLEAEAQSANAVYPHKIFEVGKVAFIDEKENLGTRTTQSLGFLTASASANFNDVAGEVATILYYLGKNYDVRESNDPRFIHGRQATIVLGREEVGIFGEINPSVLENWQIGVPCVACEIDLNILMSTTGEMWAQKDKMGGDLNEEIDQVNIFNKYIKLIVAKIVRVEINDNADNLYVEYLDDGSGIEKIIQSGIRSYITKEDLLGKHVIMVANLPPRKFKKVDSQGMLLACIYKERGDEKVELLCAPDAAPGTPVVLEGYEDALEKPAKISLETFAKVDCVIEEHIAKAAGKTLLVAGKPIVSEKIAYGKIH